MSYSSKSEENTLKQRKLLALSKMFQNNRKGENNQHNEQIYLEMAEDIKNDIG